MVDDWTTATAEVAAALGLLPRASEVAGIAQDVADMRPPREGGERGYDPTTLMFPNHRASRLGGSLLPQEIANDVHQRFYDWQAARGYGDLSIPEKPAFRRPVRFRAG
jgi:hypothetical protein